MCYMLVKFSRNSKRTNRTWHVTHDIPQVKQKHRNHEISYEIDKTIYFFFYLFPFKNKIVLNFI